MNPIEYLQLLIAGVEMGSEIPVQLSELRWLKSLIEQQSNEKIMLPREMDEDLYYRVGSVMGAQSPEQCGRADKLWDQLVAYSDNRLK